MKQTSPPEPPVHPSERYFDWFSALLLMAAMIAAALRLSATDWAPHLSITQSIVFWGMLLGLAVGKSTYSPRAAFLFGLDYGIIIIPWQLGLLLYSPKVEWNERLLSMGGRLWQIIGEISRREQVTDSLLFLVLMSVLFWALSTYAGYILIRKAGVWRAVVPMGITALVIETFDPIITRRAWFVAIYLFLALMLVARTHYLVNVKRWREIKTHVPSDTGYEQTRVAVAVVLLLVILSWNMPASASDIPVLSKFYREEVEPLRQKFWDEISFAFSSLRESVGLVYDFYSDQMILGSGSAHTDKVEMRVEAPGFLYVGQRYYWRGRVYDQYQDGGWSTTITDVKAYAANELLNIPDSPERIQAIFKFRPQQAILTMYSAGQPLKFSRAGDVQSEINPDETQDLVAFKASPYLRSGELYEVTASLPSFTEKQLRSAGVEYPPWVTERYLQLPEEITPRSLELARTITANFDNPYDKAKAITGWLRENIEYLETLDDSPGRQEPIDWFLFTYQKGFCNYYATAEIVLLRSLGIPARMAVGYSQGEGIQADDPAQMRANREEGGGENLVIYTVRQKNAHAWPEVYFPGFGWVEFEPTASEDPIFRPTGIQTPLEPLDEEVPDILPDDVERDQPDSGADDQAGGDETSGTFGPLKIGLAVIALAASVGLIGLALFARQRNHPTWVAITSKLHFQFHPLPVQLERGIRSLGLQPPAFIARSARFHLLPELSKAYVEIDHALTRLGRIPKPSQTPAERAADLVQVLPVATIAVDQLVREYQLGTYSTYQADDSVAHQASMLIRRQSRLMRLKNFLDRLIYPLKRRLTGRGMHGWRKTITPDS